MKMLFVKYKERYYYQFDYCIIYCTICNVYIKNTILLCCKEVAMKLTGPWLHIFLPYELPT